MNKVKKSKNVIRYNDKDCTITVNGKVVATWNDEANCDYPEDLIWGRDIGALFTKAFEAGYDLAKEEKE
jgi:hypothetical protein